MLYHIISLYHLLYYILLLGVHRRQAAPGDHAAQVQGDHKRPPTIVIISYEYIL